MKRTILFVSILLSVVYSQAQPKQSPDPAEKGFEIRIKIDGYKSDKMFLGNYFGDKEYLKDSAVVNKKGWFVFKRDEPLPCGIYSVINSERNARIIEFVVNSEDQFFSLETDTIQPVLNMKVVGSDDNALFSTYQKYMVNNGKKRQELGKAFGKAKKSGNKDSMEMIQKQADAMDADYEAFRGNIVNTHPATLTARVIKVLMDIKIPDSPVNPDGTVDSLFPYRYYKAHFWDNVDFTEDCLVRTPFFHPKLETYMTKMILQYPDTIIAEADYLVSMARGKKELYHYIVWWTTMTYERSNLMCMDKVPVHMWKHYYKWPNAFWVDTTTMVRIQDRLKVMEPLCCDKIAPNLIMKDMDHKYRSMHAIQSKYTVLLFWDPDCSHCKKEMPVIKKMYDSLHKLGVEVYAVGVEQEYDKWKQFIIDNKLDWINVIDIYNETNFRTLYDINSTPVIYLLDSDKKIIAKKMGAELLTEILERELGIKDKNAPFPEQKEDSHP